MKLAAIDVGSNSIHMIVVEVSPEGAFRVIDQEKELVGLGRGTLERNFLSEDAMKRGFVVLRKYVNLARRHGVDETLAVATSAVRESLNGGDFIERARRETGIAINVVSPIEEARLIGLAVRDGIELEGSTALALDLGGGSLEMILLEKGEFLAAESVKLGVIRLAERFLPEGGRLGRASRRRLVEHIRGATGDFLALAKKQGLDTVVATSGTFLTLGALASGTVRDPDGDASAELLNGRTVAASALKALSGQLCGQLGRERARLPGVGERRADTIAVGAVLLDEVLTRLGLRSIVLCDRALREGIVVDYLARNRARIGRAEAVPNLRRRSVLELAERYGFDPRHAAQVARFALRLFDRTRSLHGLGEDDRQMLEYGAILHDVGTHIAYEGHQRHGYYLIKNGGLRGFRPDEIELLAGLALYHRKRGPRPGDACLRRLPRTSRRSLGVMAGILRVADGLDRSHYQVVKDLRLRRQGNVVSVELDAGEDPELELWAAARKGRLFEKATGAELRFVLKRGRKSGRAMTTAPEAPGNAAVAGEAET